MILTQKLIAFAVMLQALELLLIHKTLSEDGIWRWSDLKKELGSFFGVFLAYPNFIFVLLLTLVSALIVLFSTHTVFLYPMLVGTLLTSIRFRGVFNGGSDYMTVLILLSLSVAESFKGNEKVQLACLYYIGFQVCLSYFISGVVKIRNAEWRKGQALAGFVQSANYSIPETFQRLLKNPSLVFFLSWGIIVFECIFPLAFVNAYACLVLISMAFLFHLANFYIFGLNRFLFAWAAGYPALYYCSTTI